MSTSRATRTRNRRLDGYDGLVVLGGPMSVNDDDRLPHLVTEMNLIEAALSRNLPVLGICLGAQLIAKTLGAAVYPNQEKEIGWYDVSPTDHAQSDPLLGAFSATEKIFQWHGETFDIPEKHAAISLSLPYAPIKLFVTALMSTAFSFIWKSTSR